MNVLAFNSAALGCVLTSVRRPVSSDRAVCAGLVERRLFDLAALECRNQLSRPDLPARDRVDWTVELIRILTQEAVHTGPTERAGKWQAAHPAAADFLAQAADHPRRLLIQMQDALTSLAEGELAQIEAEVAAEPPAALEQARTSIRQASRAFEELDKQLTEQVGAAPIAPPPPTRCRAMNWWRCRTTCDFSWPAPFATRHCVMRPGAMTEWPH